MSEEVNVLREFIDWELEFMIVVFEIIVGVFKDGIKRERIFLIEEDYSFKKKFIKKFKLCREFYGLWKCENFKKMIVNER